jgi:hypothetical protein
VVQDDLVDGIVVQEFVLRAEFKNGRKKERVLSRVLFKRVIGERAKY